MTAVERQRREDELVARTVAGITAEQIARISALLYPAGRPVASRAGAA